MYVTRNAEAFNPVIELFIDLQRRENPPIQGENQKQRAISEARRQGYREGMIQAITTILNRHRCDTFPQWETLPLLDAHDVGKVVQEWLDKYEVMATDLPHMPKTPEERALVEGNINNFLLELDEYLRDMAVGGEIAEREQERHMQAVVAGEEDPIESDRPWLEERLAKARALNKEIEELIKVVTPKSRPIKDQPQA